MEKKVLKTRTRFSNSLRNDLYEKLQQLSTETDIPLSKLLDKAVSMLIVNMRLSNRFDKVDEKKSPDNE